MWVIADTHFSHKNIIRYTGRPFETTEQMDEIIIKNWNREVKGKETVFILGDFALSTKDHIKEIASRLHGYKVLIIGNHDMRHSYRWWLTVMDEVYKYPIIYKDFLLSHYKIEGTRFRNLYGHIHEKGTLEDGCVCVELTNYRPIKLEDL